MPARARKHPTRRPKPHPTPRPRAPSPCPCPCGSIQAPILVTSGARARVMGDWRRLSPTKPSNRLNQPIAGLQKKSDNPANQSPSPRPPLQQPTPSRMHPSKPIAGIGADSVGVREGARAGIRSHKYQGEQPLTKKGGGGNGGHAPNTPKTPRQTRDNSPTELRKPSEKMRQSASVSIRIGPSRAD
jgi:hypothetical protein